MERVQHTHDAAQTRIGWTMTKYAKLSKFLMCTTAIIALSVIFIGATAYAEQIKYYPSEGITLKIEDDGSLDIYENDSGVTNWSHMLQRWNPSQHFLSRMEYNATWVLQRYKNLYQTGQVLYTQPASPYRKIEEYDNSRTFYKGGNLPWISYGHDFGSRSAADGFSIGQNEGILINKLNQFAGGVVRVFVFCDLRDTVDFSGPSLRFYDEAKLYRDMDALLEAARATGTRIMPALFDYMISDGVGTDHPEVITNAAKRAELMGLVSRFVSRYAGRDEILMWDLMNEPFYGTDASSSPQGTVSVSDMTAFMNAVMAAVRANDPKMAAMRILAFST